VYDLVAREVDAVAEKRGLGKESAITRKLRGLKQQLGR
jgi:hypothetical protein